MFFIKQLIFLLLAFFFCFFNLSSSAFSDNNWRQIFKDSSKPGRTKVHPISVRQQNEGSLKRAVHLKHASYLLDEAHIPHIKKNNGHILLQLTQPLNSSIQQQLKNHGVELLEYIPSNTWKAKISATAVQKVKNLNFVHAMGDIYPVDKLPEYALENDFSTYSYHNDGTISVLVSFHADTLFNRVDDILFDISGTTEQNDFLSGQRVLIRIPQDQLPAISEYDEVNWIENKPAPKKGNNENAAFLSNLDILQGSPYSLSGSGVAIGEWDAGAVQDDHPDLSGRVTNVESNSIHSHSTHVAGTIIGDGTGSADAKGMAPSVTLYSYDYFDDVTSEMSTAVSTYDIALSNNSWGYIFGWEPNYYGDGMDVFFDDSGFGDYTSESRAWDQTVLNTDLIIVKSAGNDRNDDGDQALSGHHHAGDSSSVFYCSHLPDGDYDCIGSIGAAKNIITVGAVNDSGSMLSFSSWGPMDDGRVKPDIVANGYSLKSTFPTSTYGNYSGTSMSAPVVTGAIALIIERYVDIFGTRPSAAMVKALLINSAIDKGNTGPDYSYGWGLLDANEAVELINSEHDILEENSISNNETLEYTITIPVSENDLKISIVWTDRAGSIWAASALANDIDLELEDPDAGIHRPWTLDPDNPSASATTGINTVDNVEQIVMNSPEPGDWTLRIIGSSIQSSQTFALAIKMPTQVPSMTSTGATVITTESATLTGNLDDLGTASSVEVSFEWGLDTNYGNETAPQSLTSTGIFSDTISGLSPGTTYHYRVKAVGDGTDYGLDMTFTTDTEPPAATTDSSTDVATNSATLQGSLVGLGSASSVDVSFEWGLDTNYGNETTPQSLTSTDEFNDTISGLSPNTTYHFRTKAVGDGTDYGDGMTFTTSVNSSIDIEIVLQGSNRPDPEGWEIPVTIGFFTPGADVLADTPVYEFTPTASKGVNTAVCTVTGVTPGTYDISVVSDHTLMNVQRNAPISGTFTSLYMGTLLEGDTNMDHVIDWNNDGITIYIGAAFRACEGDTYWNSGADLDHNGCIDGEDYNLYLANVGNTSPIELSLVDISVELQGANRPDPEGWEIPVTIGFFTPGADVLADSPVYEFMPTASKVNDMAACTITGISHGTYDITVMSDYTLMNVQRNVQISGTSTAAYMGTLLEGDTNMDHVIDWNNDGFNIYIGAAFHACEGDASWWNPGADLDHSGCIDGEDYNLYLANEGKSSPVEIP